MLDWLYDIINYPLIKTHPEPEMVEGILVQKEPFIFSPLNIFVFLVIYILAKIGLKYTKRYFKKFNLDDKVVGLEGRSIALWKLTKQVSYVLVAIFCFFSLRINNSQIDFSSIMAYEFVRFNEKIHFAVYHLFVIVIVIFLARIALSFIRLYVHNTLGKNGRVDEGTEYVYVQLAKYVVYVIAVLTIFRSFGATLDVLIGALAAVAVAVAFAIQGILRDYISGFLLLFETTIKIGDVIEIKEPNGEKTIATVRKINLRTSKVESTFGRVLIIPNSILTHESVTNWNLGKEITRFSIKVTVQYGVDTDKVKEILIKCAREHPRVSKNRDIAVWLKDFGDNGLLMELVFWSNNNFFIEQYLSDIRFAIDHEFRKEGIIVPFPQRDIRVTKD